MAWPSAEEFARDLRISGVRARAWKARNSIPSSYWRATVSAAQRRGISGVSLEALAQVAEEADDTLNQAQGDAA